MIGDEVEVMVIGVRGNRVRLGIHAPSQVQVHRKEVYEAIKKNNPTGIGVDNNRIPIHSSPSEQTSEVPVTIKNNPNL